STSLIGISATAFDGTHTYAAPSTFIHSVQGESYSGPVATFWGTDDGDAGNYSAQITWGDDSAPTTGTISYQGEGVYQVSGVHTYGQAGNFAMQLGISDAGAGAYIPMYSAANVAFPPDLMISGPAASATSMPYSLDLSAMFPAFFDGDLNDISSWTVNWGDGNIHTYYQTPTFNPGWAVVTHSYSGSTGLFDITATAFDGTHTYTAPETIAVALNFSGSGDAIQATQGQSYSGPVATFVGTLDGDTSNYSASITWGDGSTQAGGTISYQGNGTYEVTGSYTYEQEGTFGIQVGIAEADDGAQVSVNGTADVAVAPTTASAITLPGILPTYSPNGPASNPTLPSGMNTFTLNSSEISGSPAAWAPVFAASDPTAQPDQTITVTGSHFTDYPNLSNAFADTQFIVYGQTSSSNGTFSNAKIQDPTLDGAMLTIDTSEPSNSLYLVWAVNGGGASAPIAVNQTTAWWAGAPTEPVQQSQSPTSVSAYLGQTLSVYGENLSNGAATPQSWVYLQPTGGGSGTWATVTAANPYKVDFTVPGTLTVGGTYQIWINNGLGGQYSWSKTPTTLSVAASSAPTWSSQTLNVTQPFTYQGKQYQAVGDGVTNNYAAIQAALDSLQHGETLYFPAGTYVVEPSSTDGPLVIPHDISNIRIEGAGARTTILFTGDYIPTEGGGNYLEFGQEDFGPGDIEFDSMTFEYAGNDELPSGSSGFLIFLRHDPDVTFNQVTLISGPLEALAANGADPGGETSIENSTVIGTAITVDGQSDVFISGDNFFMGYDSDCAIIDAQTNGVSITNCTVQDYDDSADNSSGKSQARFTDFGLSQDQYVADNETINLKPDGPNEGEQNDAEGSQVYYFGSITSATNDTVQFDIAAAIGVGECVVVAGGTGFGQLEPITAVSNVGNLYTLTLAGNWNDKPDSTSTIEVVSETYDCVFYANALTDAPGAYGNAGFALWSGGYGNIFDNNMVQNVITGASLDSAGGNADYFNVVANNRFNNTLQGVDLNPPGGNVAHGTPNDVGVVVRDNTVDGGVSGILVAGASGGNSYPATLTILEHNFIAPSAEAGTVYYPNATNTPIPAGGVVVQGNNVDTLLYNNTFVEPTPIQGSNFPLPPAIYYDSSPTAAILLRNNQYEGLGSNAYLYATGVSSPSLIEIPSDVYYATVASGSSSPLNILLWDDGASSLSWSATIASGTQWLTVTTGDPGNGTISGEDDKSGDGILSLTTNSGSMSPGIYSSTVTLTAGGKTRVITVFMTVTL
ncbi:MAG: glycosyl hydrolase family 28-related protein, partial [Tepidisphaeraceae bacterium]